MVKKLRTVTTQMLHADGVSGEKLKLSWGTGGLVVDAPPFPGSDLGRFGWLFKSQVRIPQKPLGGFSG